MNLRDRVVGYCPACGYSGCLDGDLCSLDARLFAAIGCAPVQCALDAIESGDLAAVPDVRRDEWEPYGHERYTAGEWAFTVYTRGCGDPYFAYLWAIEHRGVRVECGSGLSDAPYSAWGYSPASTKHEDAWSVPRISRQFVSAPEAMVQFFKLWDRAGPRWAAADDFIREQSGSHPGIFRVGMRALLVDLAAKLGRATQ